MDWNEFTVLATVHLLGLFSPGPDTLAVISNALSDGTKAGVQTSLGIAIGNLAHAGLGVLGVSALAMALPNLIIALSAVGAVYLGYIGLSRIKNHSKSSINTATLPSDARRNHFVMQGLITNVTNIKCGLFFIMVFTTLISPHNSLPVKFIYVAWIVLVTFLFFSLVAFFFRNDGISSKLGLNAAVIDKISGFMLIALAILLLFNITETALAPS